MKIKPLEWVMGYDNETRQKTKNALLFNLANKHFYFNVQKSIKYPNWWSVALESALDKFPTICQSSVLLNRLSTRGYAIEWAEQYQEELIKNIMERFVE